MFTLFSSVPLSQSPPDVLQEVQDILDVQGITFGTLITNALRDTTKSLGATVISELANILDALRPHLDEDKEARALLGKLFASVISPELSQFEKGDDEMSWRLPATRLSTEQLMKFSLEEMGKRIVSGAPGLSSFLSGICGEGKSSGCEKDDEKGTDSKDDDVEDEDDPEFGTEASRKASPARLLEIVSSFACYLYLRSSSEIEEDYYREYHPKHAQPDVQCISGRNRCFPPLDAHPGPCHQCSPPRRYHYFLSQYITRYQIHVSRDNQAACHAW